ncbi:MAG TPA: RNA polymerase sigma factor [Caulobacteraceae bacterium]|jgi:RNA polymerase sigma-70 factor (ECF subfamily)
MSLALTTDYAALPDAELVRLIVGRDAAATRFLITRSNQRLYRAAWSILMNRAEAEEAVQDGYLKAFAALPRFRGEAQLSTWLTRIVVNEALERRRKAGRRRKQLETQGVSFIDSYREALMRGSETSQTPEQSVMRTELARLIEAAIGRLPEVFRPVFVMREIEGLDVAETAEALGLAEATVRTRLHRAKQRLQAELAPELAGLRAATLPFAGLDCQRLTDRVMAKLGYA